MSDLENFNTIQKIHAGFDAKKITPSELTKFYLKRVRSDSLNAFLTVTEERALEQAKACDAVLAKEGKTPKTKQPLFGIPTAIKDNLVIDGIKTTCASKLLENYHPPYTATAVERLEAAGSITLGKTNLDEFAMGGSNENSAFGPVKHPKDAARVAGGSSGGSAAAVGGGLSVVSLGSDTGGSIRLPASFCGVVGMKPTYGTVSRYGLVAFGSSLDQIGPFGNTVQDAATVYAAMSGHDPKDSTSAPRTAFDLKSFTTLEGTSWKSIKIGVPKEYFTGGLAPEVEKSIQSAMKEIEKAGAKLIPISLPHSKYAVSVYYLVAVSEASSNLARFDGVRYGVRLADAPNAKDIHAFYRKVRGLGFGPEVKRRIILGTFALSAGYADQYYSKACQVRRLIKNDFDEAFKQVDVVLSPVSPTTAIKIGEKASDPLQMYLMDIFTIPANLAGLPALSLPVKSSGLPVGLQLQGPAFSESKLFSIARAIEQLQVSQISGGA